MFGTKLSAQTCHAIPGFWADVKGKCHPPLYYIIVTHKIKQAITNQPNDTEAVYRALVALGNMIYAARQFNNLLPAEEAQARSTLEGVENMSFTPKVGQSASELATDKRKIASLVKEILNTL